MKFCIFICRLVKINFQNKAKNMVMKRMPLIGIEFKVEEVIPEIQSYY